MSAPAPVCPGLRIALARPDLRLALIEPLLRRATFLDEVVDELGLGDRVQVLRGRAEDMIADVSRETSGRRHRAAVAPLDRLAGWCLPLGTRRWVAPGVKGRSAADEVATMSRLWQRSAVAHPTIEICAAALLQEPTTVVESSGSACLPADRPRNRNRHAAKTVIADESLDRCGL